MLVAFLGAPASRVFAEPPGAPPSASDRERPWERGVSAERKARANGLLAAGNELLIQNRYAEALRFYEAALAVWDHPALRANMVVCFINLGRVLEAHESAHLALRHGSAPYTNKQAYAETRAYARLLDAQVARLEVRCDEAAAQVTLDGQALMTCPGRRERWLLAGTHQVVARKPGHLTLTRDLVFRAGASERLDIELVTLADAARIERRWDAWKPWAVTAAGGALLIAGGLLQLEAAADMARHDEGLRIACGTPGCPAEEVPPWLERLKSRATTENRIAVGAAIAGASVAVAGLVAVYLNRPQTVLPDESGFARGVIPVLVDGGGAVLFEGTF